MWYSLYLVGYSCILLIVNTGSTFDGMTESTSTESSSDDPVTTNANSSSVSVAVVISDTTEGDLSDADIEPHEAEQNDEGTPNIQAHLTNSAVNDFTHSTERNSVQVLQLTDSTEKNSLDFTTTTTASDSLLADPMISMDQYKYEALLKLYQENDTLRELTSSINELCPDWKPCLRRVIVVSPGDGANDLARCCLSCTCDDLCLSTRSCCPGYRPHYFPVNQSDYQDTPKLCLKSALFTKDQALIDTAQSFDMVASCPDGTPEVLTDKCKALMSNDSTDSRYMYSFVDIVPVTDALSSTNFANRHCAACNNLPKERYRYWTISYDCYLRPPTDGIPIEREVELRDDCLLNLKPPSQEIGNATRCFQNVISSCNSTGQWEVYDSKTEAFCHDMDLLFYSAVTKVKRSSLYKNMFCAICNGDLYADVNNASCPNTNLGEFVRTFTAVLNFKPALEESSTSDTSTHAYSCPTGHKVDPLSMQCKEVVCSHPRILNKISMECEDLYLAYNFGSIERPFKAVISRRMNAAELDVFDHHLKEHLFLTIGNDAFCNFFSTFYHTDALYNSTDSNGFLDELLVTNVTVIAYVNLGSPTIRSADEVVSEFLSIDSVIYNNRINFVYGESDTYFLPSVQDGANNPETKVVFLYRTGMERRKKRDSQMFKAFRDPYDSTAVLTFALYEFADQCVADKLLYRKSYFDCPAFVYNMNKSKIHRISTGIVLQNELIRFDFGEFKSVNETHVAICLYKLEEKGLQTNSTLRNLSGDASFGKIRKPTMKSVMTLVTLVLALIGSVLHINSLSLVPLLTNI